LDSSIPTSSSTSKFQNAALLENKEEAIRLFGSSRKKSNSFHNGPINGGVGGGGLIRGEVKGFVYSGKCP